MGLQGKILNRLHFGKSGVLSARLSALGYLSHLKEIVRYLDSSEIEPYDLSVSSIVIDTVAPMHHKSNEYTKAGLYQVRVYQDVDIVWLAFRILPFQYENGEATFLYHLVTMLQEGTRKAAPRLKKKLPSSLLPKLKNKHLQNKRLLKKPRT